jgi:hypothetical protein
VQSLPLPCSSLPEARAATRCDSKATRMLVLVLTIRSNIHQRIDTVEVSGSSPHGPTILFNKLPTLRRG